MEFSDRERPSILKHLRVFCKSKDLMSYVSNYLFLSKKVFLWLAKWGKVFLLTVGGWVDVSRVPSYTSIWLSCFLRNFVITTAIIYWKCFTPSSHKFAFLTWSHDDAIWIMWDRFKGLLANYFFKVWEICWSVKFST